MKQILVLEDEENLNEGISTFLRKEGYHVLSAFSIREARALLDKKTDLIISDVTLPDGNAMEFWRKVRKTRETYLIYLTVLDKETDMLNGYDSGADDYITKPFSIRVLISKVHALMKRIEEKEPENLVSGNLVLKLGTMQVMRDRDYIPGFSGVLRAYFIRTGTGAVCQGGGCHTQLIKPGPGNNR